MDYDHRHFAEITKTVKLQLIIGLIITAVMSCFRHGINGVGSAILGVALVIIPTLMYAKIAFANGMVSLPNIALVRHQKAMLARFFINILLFVLVFIVYKNCDFLALFIAYFATLSSYWFSLIKK